MAILFFKLSTDKVAYTKGTDTIYLDPDYLVAPYPDALEQIELRRGSETIRFPWSEVITPATASRAELVELLGSQYFVRRIGSDSYSPLKVTDGAVGANEVDPSNSDWSGWEGASGAATEDEFLSLFKSPFSTPITNTSGAPKYLDIAFDMTKGSMFVGLGANTGGTFQNVIVEVIGSGGAVRTVVPEKLVGTPATTLGVEFESDFFNKLRITFNTSEPIALTNVTIRKAQLTSSQIRGETDAGLFRTVGLTSGGALKVDITRDIFGNLPVADQFGIWDGTSIFDYLNTLFYTNLLTGGATIVHQKDTSSYLFTVAAGEIAARQLKTRTKYQPLKAHKAAETCLLVPEVGVKKWVGYADLDNYTSAGEATVDGTIQNGVALLVYGPNTYLQLWNNAVQTLGTGDGIERADWNIDTLDGSGGPRNPSGIMLNLAYSQIALQEMEWLGVGSVLFYLNIEGTNIPIHRVDNANYRTQLVYMRTANLSPFWKVEGVASGGTMSAICNAVVSGGGHNPVGVPRVVETTAPITLAANVQEAVLFIRLKPEAYEADVQIKGFGGLMETRSNAVFDLHFNPAWSGTAIVWQDVPNSHIQVAQAQNDNLITSPGIVISEAFVAADGAAFSQQITSKLKLGKELQNNAPNQTSRYDVMVLSATAYTNNETTRALIQYVDNG